MGIEVNDGTVVNSSDVSAETASRIESGIEKGDVRPDFLNTINELRKDAGLTNKVTETAPKEQKSEVIKETVVEEKVVSEKPTEEPAEKKEGVQEDSDELQTPEGETVKATRIAEVKDWGKGWQETANSYKPAQDFITERFQGNFEEAEIAANIFESVLGTDLETFDPSKVLNELSELSKPRAEKLIHFFATNPSVQEMARQGVIETVFGKNLSPEELAEDIEGYKLFKQAGGLSALLDQDGELPVNLQYDAEGNPRTEDELNIFKSFLTEVKGIKTDRQKDAEAKAEQARVAQESELNTRIQNYTEERFDGVKNVVKQVGLEILPTDSPEIQATKQRDANMINYYVVGRASDDKAFNGAYKSAVDAIQAGDAITANRKKVELNSLITKYTSEIVDDYIAKNNIKIDAKSNQINKARETKKEVSLSGGEVTAVSQRPANEKVEDAITRLVREGKISKA